MRVKCIVCGEEAAIVSSTENYGTLPTCEIHIMCPYCQTDMHIEGDLVKVKNFVIKNKLRKAGSYDDAD